MYNPQLADKIIKYVLDYPHYDSAAIAENIGEEHEGVKDMMSYLAKERPDAFRVERGGRFHLSLVIIPSTKGYWKKFIQDGGYAAKEQASKDRTDQERSEKALDEQYKKDLMRRARNTQRIAILSIIISFLAMLISLFKK